ncbi:MAG: transposase [Planctomycetes bacterium]|nr:transposase [Planctomycetota bacterium]
MAQYIENGVMGIDLADRVNEVCLLDAAGEVIRMESIMNTKESLVKHFSGFRGWTVAMEAGIHSAWVSRVLAELGHRVLIGNSRRIREVWDSSRKCDARDAEMLARTARFDPSLLSPVVHRGPEAQAHLQILKSREALVQARASRINPVYAGVRA